MLNVEANAIELVIDDGLVKDLDIINQVLAQKNVHLMLTTNGSSIFFNIGGII